MFIEQLSKDLGIPLSEIIKRCIMFKINYSSKLSQENIDTLSYYVAYEGKVKYSVFPSSMNVNEN